MKKILFFLLICPLSVFCQNQPQPASVSQVQAGTSKTTFISPYTLATGGYVSSNSLVNSTIISTNFISGQVYSNSYGVPIMVSASAVLTEAAVSGVSALELRAIGSRTNLASQPTALGTVVGSITNSIIVHVPANGTYTFTNTSSGAGNSATVTGGQIEIPGSSAASGVFISAANESLLNVNSAATATVATNLASGVVSNFTTLITYSTNTLKLTVYGANESSVNGDYTRKSSSSTFVEFTNTANFSITSNSYSLGVWLIETSDVDGTIYYSGGLNPTDGYYVSDFGSLPPPIVNPFRTSTTTNTVVVYSAPQSNNVISVSPSGSDALGKKGVYPFFSMEAGTAVATSGDTIELDAGVFDSRNRTIVVPANVSIVGRGRTSTILTNVHLFVSTNNSIKDLSVFMNNHFALRNKPSGSITNLLVENCRFYGEADVLLWDAWKSFKFDSSKLYGAFDIVTISGGDATSLGRFYNCELECGPGVNTGAIINENNDGGWIEFYGGSMKSAGNTYSIFDDDNVKLYGTRLDYSAGRLYSLLFSGNGITNAPVNIQTLTGTGVTNYLHFEAGLYLYTTNAP